MKKGIVIDSTGKWTVVLTPEGEFLKIPSRPDHLEGKEVLFTGSAAVTTRRNKGWTKNMFRGLSALAACILLFLVISPFFGTSQAYAAVTIDINPSLELEVDEEAIVIQVNSFNEAGQKLLGEIEWKDKPLQIVTVAVIEKAETMGYMNEQEQVIITTTYLREEGKENITKLIEDTVNTDQNLTFVLVEGNKQWHEEAKEQKIPPGSYIVEKKVAQEGIQLKEKNIKKVNLKELPAVQGIKVIKVDGKEKKIPGKALQKEENKQQNMEVKKQQQNLKKEERKQEKEQEKLEKEQAKQEKQQEKKERQQEKKEKQQEKKEKQQEKNEAKKETEDTPNKSEAHKRPFGHDGEDSKQKEKNNKKQQHELQDSDNRSSKKGPNNGPPSHVKDKNQEKEKQKQDNQKDKGNKGNNGNNGNKGNNGNNKDKKNE